MAAAGCRSWCAPTRGDARRLYLRLAPEPGDPGEILKLYLLAALLLPRGV